jgi:integrase
MKGTIELRRRFRGLGELRLASGTRNPKTADKLDAMLLTLADAGRYDVLRALQKRQLLVMEVWEHFRSGNLAALPSPAALKQLKPAWDRWLRTFQASDGHRTDAKNYGARLQAIARKSATVRDLPGALRSFRETCAEAGTAVTFNRARAIVQAFLRDTMGRRDEVYGQVQEIGVLKAAPRAVAGGQTPASAKAIAGKLPLPLARMWLAMCVTGMGPAELEGPWENEGEFGRRIHGTKREGRDRLVPRLFDELPRPAHTGATLRKAMREAKVGATPYDARRTFAHWMEGAGIPRARRKLYMGHGAADVTDLYEAHDVANFLKADQALLGAHLGIVDGDIDGWAGLVTNQRERRKSKR